MINCLSDMGILVSSDEVQFVSILRPISSGKGNLDVLEKGSDVEQNVNVGKVKRSTDKKLS